VRNARYRYPRDPYVGRPAISCRSTHDAVDAVVRHPAGQRVLPHAAISPPPTHGNPRSPPSQHGCGLNGCRVAGADQRLQLVLSGGVIVGYGLLLATAVFPLPGATGR
jgi:hypothetical protein